MGLNIGLFKVLVNMLMPRKVRRKKKKGSTMESLREGSELSELLFSCHQKYLWVLFCPFMFEKIKEKVGNVISIIL